MRKITSTDRRPTGRPQKILLLSDHELSEAYNSGESSEDIAQRAGCTKKTLNRHWWRMRVAGTLPQKLYNRQRKIDDTEHRADGVDGRLSLRMHDPLLSRLIDVHGEPRPDIYSGAK